MVPMQPLLLRDIFGCRWEEGIICDKIISFFLTYWLVKTNIRHNNIIYEDIGEEDMIVTELNEQKISRIGHAFGYYDYGQG